MKVNPNQLDLSKNLNFKGGNIQLDQGTILVGDGTETSPAIAFSSDPGTGLFLANPGEIAISAGANAFVYLKDDGTVEMTGTTGLAVQAGSTAERPSVPLDGIIRFNLDTNQHETFVNDAWTEYLLDSDARFNEARRLSVRKNPGKRQYGSIAAALAAVTNPTVTDPVLIDVGPGLFEEPTLNVPKYVAIRGASGVTVVKANAPNQHLFRVDTNVNIANMVVRGVSGAGYAAFYANSTNTVPTAGTYLRDIKFGDNNTQVLVEQTTVGTFCTIYVEGSMIGAHGAFDKGFVAKGPGAARINTRSMTTNGMTAPGPTNLFYAEGPLSTVLSTGSLFRNSLNTGVGIQLRNGATGRFVGVSLLGFSKAIWIENNGAAPVFNGDGINLQSNTMDLIVDHPGTTGHFMGCASRTKVSVDSATTMTVFYSDPTSTGITSVGPLYLGPSHAKTTEMSELIGRTTTMGVLTGGKLTAGSGFNVNVTAGFGYCSIEDPIHRPVKIYWPNSSIALPANTASYLYVTNTGILSSSAGAPSLTESVVLGRVVTNGSAVAWIEEIPSDATHLGNNLETMLRESFGSVYASGSIVVEGASPRTISVTSGTYYFGSIKISPSGGNAVVMRQFYHNSGAWTYADSNSISNTLYDNGTSLTALTAGYYARHSLYVTGEGVNERYIMVYAQAQYASLVQAESAALPSPPSLIDESVTLIASVIVKQDQANIVSIFDHRPVLGFASAKLSAASDHGNLLGLEDDDHKQYLLANGVRPLAGTLNMGGNIIADAGLINGVSITGHASRHLPNGADPLATSLASTLVLGAANSAGTANAFARADHTHEITGAQPLNANLTALTAPTLNGYYVRTGPNTAITQSITGMANTINVVNGSGVAGPTIIGIVNNAILPGNASLTLPIGTTLQRATTPVAGMIRYNSTLARFEYYRGTAWYTVAETADLTSYLRLDGTTSMTGALNLGAQAITNAGAIAGTAITGTTFNGITLETISSRHLPNGADPLATAAAVSLNLTTTNAAGTANAFARADHTHALTGVQAESAQLTSLAAINNTGHIVRTGENAFATRTLSGTSGRTVISNGDGVLGNPTVDLATVGTAGVQYDRATIDAYGRVTGGLLDTDTFTSLLMESPASTGNWPVINTATAFLDPVYTTFTVRGFDDSRSEGIGITSSVPTGATTLKIQIFGRARTTPTTSVNSIWQVYARRFPTGATPPAWSSAVAMTTINNAANIGTFATTDTTLAISALGLVAGNVCQLEVVRVGANAGDTLAGDYMVGAIRIDWT